jgi:cytochrome c-type biogenesis protein
MSLLLLSFIAGILTVLAPCAFMLLPVIIGGSVGNGGRYRPYVITISLALSLFLFTILLKATSLLINIDPVFLKYFSGITVVFLGLISLFPEAWDTISAKFRLSSSSDGLLDKAKKKDGVLGAILTGAALGPVFSACSPTYVYILTTVLRQNLQDGLVNMLAYILGLSAIMLGVAVLGRKFIKSLKFAVNPQGIFKKTIAIIFILVGIAIIT